MACYGAKNSQKSLALDKPHSKLSTIIEFLITELALLVLVQWKLQFSSVCVCL